MKKYLIAFCLMIPIFKGLCQNIIQQNITGTDVGTIFVGSNTIYQLVFTNPIIGLTATTVPISTDNQPVAHNSQSITNTIVTTPTSSTAPNPDGYGNNFETLTFDIDAENPISNASIEIDNTGTTNVDISSNFKPADVYPLHNIPSSVSSYVNATDNIQSTDSHIKSIAQSLVTANTRRESCRYKKDDSNRIRYIFHSY